MFDMKKINKDKSVFFIGIGGISMSALAHILKNDGYMVSGSDFKESDTVKELISSGIPVLIGHRAENVEDAGLVVYTAAIKDDNPELSRARELGIPAIERAVLLGAMMKNYRYPVAVSGTHGKTTATSMLSHVLCESDLDPTILVGGVLPLIGGNFRDGGKDYFVTEACEYCGSFLKFFPLYSIILNIEEDHLDYFKDINDIIDCFTEFVKKTPEGGAVIANFDDPEVVLATKENPAKTVSYGIQNKSCDYVAENIVFSEKGYPEFDAMEKGEFFAHIKLSVPGLHNVSNSLAVVAVSRLLGVSKGGIEKGLASFNGTNRRFELKGEINGAKIYDDYAHHPTEIKATLAAAKATGAARVRCVFQPHTYTRTYTLKEEFSKSFADCDDLVITDIFAAREPDTGLIHARDLADVIDGAKYIKDFSDIEKYFKETAQEGDIIFTMGAGDVYKIGEEIIKSGK
jgi:UDP-N-acetylmuramate--alanine ligase